MDQFSVESNLLHQKAPTPRALGEITNLSSLKLTLKLFHNVHGYSQTRLGSYQTSVMEIFAKNSQFIQANPTCSLVSLKNIPFLFLFKIAFDFREIETEFGYHTKVMLSSLMAWFSLISYCFRLVNVADLKSSDDYFR